MLCIFLSVLFGQVVQYLDIFLIIRIKYSVKFKYSVNVKSLGASSSSLQAAWTEPEPPAEVSMETKVVQARTQVIILTLNIDSKPSTPWTQLLTNSSHRRRTTRH
ncbi:hypothetical protein JTE90_024171 [Oedothorax gibbosus]|uniref:Uncharacterized protein n=1 Tax=Oedothorax gibbosus TaxID=931172 RepID=A0AAV6UEQ3_9ARAC|nr:hypothetical protein JTE90_024171 [Oedothorax gibbosus]